MDHVHRFITAGALAAAAAVLRGAAVLALAAAPLLGQQWVAAGTLAIPRAYGLTAVLPNGKVLIAGGVTQAGGGAETLAGPVEIYDPVSGTSVMAGSLAFPRIGAVLTALPDGEVLLLGGTGLPPAEPAPPEIFKPATGASTVLPQNPVATFAQAVTRLRNGLYLITGASGAALFNPQTEQFTPTAAPLSISGYCQVLLASGDVLVVGGNKLDESTSADAPAQIYHVQTGQWQTLSGSPIETTQGACPVLANGEVFIGIGVSVGGPVAATISDPATQTFTQAGNPFASGGFLLPDGNVLSEEGSFLQLYNPLTNETENTGFAQASEPSFAQLPNGEVLAFGGYAVHAAGYQTTSPQQQVATIERFDEAAKPFTLSLPATASLAGGFGTLRLTSEAGPGFDAPVQLDCQAELFITCAVNPSVIAPGESATVSVANLAGGADITVTGLGGGASYWTQTAALGPDIVMSADPTSQTVAAGQSASYQISIASIESGPLSLACSHLPAYASCSGISGIVVISPTGIVSRTLTVATAPPASVLSGSLAPPIGRSWEGVARSLGWRSRRF